MKHNSPSFRSTSPNRDERKMPPAASSRSFNFPGEPARGSMTRQPSSADASPSAPFRSADPGRRPMRKSKSSSSFVRFRDHDVEESGVERPVRRRLKQIRTDEDPQFYLQQTEQRRNHKSQSRKPQNQQHIGSNKMIFSPKQPERILNADDPQYYRLKAELEASASSPTEPMLTDEDPAFYLKGLHLGKKQVRKAPKGVLKRSITGHLVPAETTDETHFPYSAVDPPPSFSAVGRSTSMPSMFRKETNSDHTRKRWDDPSHSQMQNLNTMPYLPMPRRHASSGNSTSDASPILPRRQSPARLGSVEDDDSSSSSSSSPSSEASAESIDDSEGRDVPPKHPSFRGPQIGKPQLSSYKSSPAETRRSAMTATRSLGSTRPTSDARMAPMRSASSSMPRFASGGIRAVPGTIREEPPFALDISVQVRQSAALAQRRRSDRSTYTVSLQPPRQHEHASALMATNPAYFCAHTDLPAYDRDDEQLALAMYPTTVGQYFAMLVPHEVSEQAFWSRYFTRCSEKRILHAIRENSMTTC